MVKEGAGGEEDVRDGEDDEFEVSMDERFILRPMSVEVELQKCLLEDLKLPRCGVW